MLLVIICQIWMLYVLYLLIAAQSLQDYYNHISHCNPTFHNQTNWLFHGAFVPLRFIEFNNRKSDSFTGLCLVSKPNFQLYTAFDRQTVLCSVDKLTRWPCAPLAASADPACPVAPRPPRSPVLWPTSCCTSSSCASLLLLRTQRLLPWRQDSCSCSPVEGMG